MIDQKNADILAMRSYVYVYASVKKEVMFMRSLISSHTQNLSYPAMFVDLHY